MASNPLPTRFGCYIGNIDRSVTLDILKQVFCQCGTIVDCSLNGREEDPYRYGFIDFASEEDRARAMKYNGFTLVGRKLKVGVSKGNVNKPEGFQAAQAGGGAAGGSAANRSHHHNMPRMDGMAGNPMANMMMPPAGGLMPQQQMEAQVLLQLIQQGTVDPGTLNDQQRSLLVTMLSSGGNNAAVASQAVPQQQQMMPQMFGAPQMWGMNGPVGCGRPFNPMAGMGGMPGMNPRYHRGPANPSPTEETLKRRELQRKQYLKAVRDCAEEYEKQLQERSAKGGRSDDDSSASDDEGKPLKRSKADSAPREEPVEAA